MNFREEYKSYNKALRPNPELVKKLQEAAREGKEGNEGYAPAEQQGYAREGKEEKAGYVREKAGRERLRAWKTVRGFACAAAACLCILVGLPTLAANVEPLYELMRRVSPQLAQNFRLVQEADEKLGIRMEVASVYLHENELQVYITLEDLEGNRIDENTDLFNSYSVNMPYPGYGGGGWKPVDFDGETGKATFLVTLGLLPDAEGNSRDIAELAGKKVTLYLGRILSGMVEYDDLKVEVSWDAVQAEPEAALMRMSGGPAPEIIKGDTEDPRPRIKMLKPEAPVSGEIVEGIYFMGMGFIDGRLHIQTAEPDYMKNNNHCELFLTDQEGNRWYYDYKVSAAGDTEDTKGIMYQDCIFEISAEELEGYDLHGHFVTTGNYLEGNWSVTFPVEKPASE